MPAAIDAGDTALAECAALLREDFASFAACCFRELNPRTPFVTNWHYELVAAKLAAVRDGRIRRLLISVPPRHLKSLTASVAFPAWCLGHDPSAQIICASYTQDLADKLSRDCRRVMASDWYRRDYPTRLSPQRQRCRSSRRPPRAAGSPPRSAVCCPHTEREVDSSVSAAFTSPRRVKVDSMMSYFGLLVEPVSEW